LFFWFADINNPQREAIFRFRDNEMKNAKKKAPRNEPRRLQIFTSEVSFRCSLLTSLANNQLVCCSAESSQVAPRGRTKVQTSVISDGL